MIYSEDAPTVECAFHNGFAERRVNLINSRKEFFAVSIEDIQQLALAKNLRVELTKLAEARDYRQTLALRAQAALRKDEVISRHFRIHPVEGQRVSTRLSLK